MSLATYYLDNVRRPGLHNVACCPSTTAVSSPCGRLAHALAAAASTPRLAFPSPEPGSGKTRSLELLELIVHRGMHTLSMTPACRSASSAVRPRILLDEVDAIFGRGHASKDHEDSGRS